MGKLTLFTKGNVDLHDSLHSCRICGELVWNGINEVLRVSHPGLLARVKHETWSRSDALMESRGVVPEILTSRQLSMGVYSLGSQFSHAIFETKADAIVLSIQPDLTTTLERHNKEGFLLYTANKDTWSIEDKQWLKRDFTPTPVLQPEESMANFALLIEKIWAAASGSNQSVSRSAFLDIGGFHPEISINEHRELALRLCKQGLRMVGATARTYHMIHRSGWRDPLQETSWEEVFYRAHPTAEVALLPFCGQV